jgi:hypothetical protein
MKLDEDCCSQRDSIDDTLLIKVLSSDIGCLVPFSSSNDARLETHLILD